MKRELRGKMRKIVGVLRDKELKLEMAKKPAHTSEVNSCQRPKTKREEKKFELAPFFISVAIHL
jgi:hypothetical protein